MFENLFESLLKGMGSDLFAKTTNIITAISPLFAAGFGVYIVIVALNAYNRGFDDNLVDLSKRAMGWMIIIACAFNAGQYLKIANMLYEFPEQLASLITSTPYTANQLDASFNDLLESMGKMEAYAAEKIPITEIGDKISLKITVLCILGLGATFLTIVAAFYLVAKISLAMVILIGPIFIGSMLFPATRQWGMNWIGQILSYALMVAFYVALGAIQQTFFESYLKTQIDAGFFNDELIGTTVLLPILGVFFLTTLVFIVITLNIPAIATALTGGATIGGFGTVLRGMMGASKGFGVGAGMPKRAYNAGKNAYDTGKRFVQRFNQIKPK